MPSVLIKGAFVIDPKNKVSGIYDLNIKDGKIAKIAENINIDSDIFIDAKGLTAAPGLVDMHVHLRDPGQIYKEDILSGTKAAAAGGITSLAAMPNTIPVCDNADIIKYIKDKEKVVKVYPVASVTKGLKGQELTGFNELKKAGAVALSDDGKPVEDDNLMETALKRAAGIGLPILSHCEDLKLANSGIINKGSISKELGVKGIPKEAEGNAVERDVNLAGKTGCAVHICHVSTEKSLDIIRQAKKRGVKVTCETAPHYFTLDETELLRKDANFRMNPPLRTKADVKAVVEAIKDGTIDAIATDHAPHTKAEKADFEKAPNGVIGMETSLSLGITGLVSKGIITLDRLIELMSVNPAKILGIEGGSLSVGQSADIVLFDENEEYKVNKNKLHGKSVNTPFDGMMLKGKVKYTLVNGNIVYDSKREV